MPGYSCPVKERMMYSSVKATFCETIHKLGLDIVKRVRKYHMMATVLKIN